MISNIDNTFSPVAGSVTSAAAACSVSLGGTVGKMTFLEGFDITGAGATAASVVVASITGIAGGPLYFDVGVGSGTTTANTPLSIRFPEPLPATGPGVPIVINLPSLGTGSPMAALTGYGFQK